MDIIPIKFLDIIKTDKTLNNAISDIDNKIEKIINNYSPVFFPEYTNHGLEHFRDTLKMAAHIIDVDEIILPKSNLKKAPIDYLSPLNITVLASSVLFHDLGMHVHFKGFKQLLDGFYDDVRVYFFNDLTWRQEWDNYIIEAKRFSGRQRINLFGDESVIISEIDFSKNSIDSDIHKKLIGEFLRRHHGRLAHEITLKGFPVEKEETIQFALDLDQEYKDIIGLIARSHSMYVREAIEYVEDKFPADPHFPHEIEVPFLMCVLRIADYFQFDSSRTRDRKSVV